MQSCVQRWMSFFKQPDTTDGVVVCETYTWGKSERVASNSQTTADGVCDGERDLYVG